MAPTDTAPAPQGTESLCLVAVHHTRTESFCHALAHRAAWEMASKGWQVELRNPEVEPVTDVIEEAAAVVVVHSDDELTARVPSRPSTLRVVLHVSDHQPSAGPERDAAGVVRCRFGPLVGSSPQDRTAWLEELDDLLAPPP